MIVFNNLLKHLLNHLTCPKHFFHNEEYTVMKGWYFVVAIPKNNLKPTHPSIHSILNQQHYPPASKARNLVYQTYRDKISVYLQRHPRAGRNTHLKKQPRAGQDTQHVLYNCNIESFKVSITKGVRPRKGTTWIIPLLYG